MPLYRLVTWPVNYPERAEAVDVEAADEAAMADLAYARAGFGYAFDFWPAPEMPQDPEPVKHALLLDVLPDPEPEPEPEPAPAPPAKKGASRKKSAS